MAQRRGPKPKNDFDDGSPEDHMGRRFPRRQVSEMQVEDESSLFYIIRNGKASLQVNVLFLFSCVKNIYFIPIRLSLMIGLTLISKIEKQLSWRSCSFS